MGRRKKRTVLHVTHSWSKVRSYWLKLGNEQRSQGTFSPTLSNRLLHFPLILCLHILSFFLPSLTAQHLQVFAQAPQHVQTPAVIELATTAAQGDWQSDQVLAAGRMDSTQHVCKGLASHTALSAALPNVLCKHTACMLALEDGHALMATCRQADPHTCAFDRRKAATTSCQGCCKPLQQWLPQLCK